MVTTSQIKDKFTAVQTILLAAEDLTKAGNLEFSEWDLTVAAWSRDRFKFGLRGYAQSYPDHKRVMMEIMGQKPNSPVFKKLLEKIRPNYYRLTAPGKTAAARLRTGSEMAATPTTKPAHVPVTVKELYDAAAVYTTRQEFRRWQDNPEEPKEWAHAASFLGIGKGADVDPADRLDEIREVVKAAIDWCKVEGAAYLTKGSGQGGTPIHVRDLSDLLDFLQALAYRFPEHLERKPHKGPKGTKRFSE